MDAITVREARNDLYRKAMMQLNQALRFFVSFFQWH
jgi:hypothetical protein